MSLKQTMYSFIFQLFAVFVFSIDDAVTPKTDNYWKDLLISTAKYIYCILLIRGAKRAFDFFYSGDYMDVLSVFDGSIKNATVFSIAASVLTQTDNILVGRQLIEVYVAYLLIEMKMTKKAKTVHIKPPTMDNKDKHERGTEIKSSINYGTGMACSYFEGYLVNVLPNDGGALHGIENNIRIAEASMGVRFPVKRLFIIVPKSMYCPPELTEFNVDDPTRPYLERCRPLSDIQRNVAGVIDRTYRNSVYKIHRGAAGAGAGAAGAGAGAGAAGAGAGAGAGARRPVCVVAECASPLNTLYKVLRNRVLYQTLSDIDVASVVADFTSTLQAVVSRSSECRNKCELIFIDDTNPEENLAEILLNRVRELAPNFEQIIEQTD